ncbi:cobyrinate a,c-diamide synthase [Candidatus Oleimmundimicrobium sp.]|uniref:cobyrinate a,c-diamide synthase n=1 Tax=Candidatus Oleimmundimicrobium sp. TaxID=3060597 RepID=UPI00271D4240|nr:cobyrinate a,c-diamide synthase [Candidatus Oleimmundimicrobium sp.]MDO8885294.1 cobyrinate a,c-diamide synthase [Candidatus Oleimmundimicrobium sp.]
MKIPRIVIAGTHSGVGKTSVAIGLMASLKKRGFKVQPFKVGPDYIDSCYHELASCKKSRNLDSWMVERDALPEIFLHGAKGSDICVIEGVMGLFDGYDGTNEVGSTAEIAKILDSPVILVVDAGKMARSVAALVKGYAEFDKDLNIEGVILNNIGSKGHYEMVKSAIENNLDLKVLGYLPRDKKLKIPERHLGLIFPNKKPIAREMVGSITEFVEKFIDVDDIISVAQRALPIEMTSNSSFAENVFGKGIRLAVAMDEAFFFYYPENLELIESLGVEIVPFSPVNDGDLPQNIHGIYIGGGYPELFGEKLEKNISLRNAIRTAIENNIPSYAECGGLMYLAEKLIACDGKAYEMVGVFPAVVKMKSKLVSLGYVDIKVGSDNVLAKEGWRLRGHEFRWSDIEVGGEIVKTYLAKKKGERKLEGYAFKNLLASYVHLHFSAKPQVVERFVMKMKKFKEEC